MHNAAMDVEFKWEQLLSQMEEGLFPVVEMSMLEVIEVKLRQSDEAAMLTDASSYALGTALFQGEDPDERPIEYASRLLKPPEKNYSTTESEVLAVVWSIQKFRGYLEEAPAVIITDYQPLRWLMSLKSPSGRLARWALQLQPYNLRIEYTPGKANVVADTLSRPFLTEEPPLCHISLIHTEFPRRGAAEIRQGQLNDPDLKKIIDAYEHGTREETERWTARGYLLTHGVLYRYSADDDNEEAQLVVPKQERDNILREFLDMPTAGHYGTDHTLTKISRHFYWPGIRHDVKDYVRKCNACQRYKVDNKKPAGLLQTPVLHQRFEFLSIDLFGPLPEGRNPMDRVIFINTSHCRYLRMDPRQRNMSTIRPSPLRYLR
jgi:hypothetical protein